VCDSSNASAAAVRLYDVLGHRIHCQQKNQFRDSLFYCSRSHCDIFDDFFDVRGVTLLIVTEIFPAPCRFRFFALLYSSLFTENGSNYTVIAEQTAGLNKLNHTIIYTTHDMKIS